MCWGGRAGRDSWKGVEGGSCARGTSTQREHAPGSQAGIHASCGGGNVLQLSVTACDRTLNSHTLICTRATGKPEALEKQYCLTQGLLTRMAEHKGVVGITVSDIASGCSTAPAIPWPHPPQCSRHRFIGHRFPAVLEVAPAVTNCCAARGAGHADQDTHHFGRRRFDCYRLAHHRLVHNATFDVGLVGLVGPAHCSRHHRCNTTASSCAAGW